MELETHTVHGPPHPRTTRNETVTRWSRAARFGLGAITFVLVAIFAGAALSAVVMDTGTTAAITHVGPLTGILFLATFAEFLATTFYLSFAAQNPRAENRMLWMIGLIALPFAIQPIYWWVHVWNAPYISDPHRDYNVPGGQLTPNAD